jgi:hypothetical protein
VYHVSPEGEDVQYPVLLDLSFLFVGVLIVSLSLLLEIEG